MGKGLMDMLIDSIFDEEWTGRHGEKLTEKELKLVKLFGRKGKTLRNVYIPKDNGETSEIDVMYPTSEADCPDRRKRDNGPDESATNRGRVQGEIR